MKCLGCGVFGHKKFQCPKGRHKQVSAIAAMRNPRECIENEDPILPFELQKEDDFDHFTSESMVKLKTGSEKKIRILRDTGAN